MNKPLIILVTCAALLGGCTKAGFNRATSFTDRKIIIYSGGKVVKEYISNGAIISEQNSDGCYFTDKATGKLIEVSADYIIEEL